MASFRFYLLNAKDSAGKLKKQELSIYLFVNHKGSRWTFKTEERIEPKHWNFKAGEVKGSYKRGGIEINEKLDDIKKRAQAAYREHEGKVVNNILKEKVGMAVEGKSVDDASVLPAVREFIESQKAIRKETTLKKYNTFLKIIEKDWPEIQFEEINMTFYDKYTGKMLDEGLLNDSIAKNVSTVKTFMDWALTRGYHQNLTYKQFEAKRVAKHDIITNTEAELQKLSEVEGLSERLERVRDLYLFQVYTGQRFSDVQAFRKEDLKCKIWDFVQIKTGKHVQVPLIGWASPAMAILEKYDYKLPQISNQKFNNYIKEVGELAKINATVEIKRKSGARTVVLKKAKWEFMSSHTARRTAVTILLERGMPPTTVMKLTGHTSLRTMQKYENTSVAALMQALEGLK
jgi:site-specific recombinase XerD